MESFTSWAAVKVVGLVASIVAGVAIGAVLAAVDDVESRYEQRGAIVADQPAGNPLQALVRAGDAEIVTAGDVMSIVKLRLAALPGDPPLPVYEPWLTVTFAALVPCCVKVAL